MSDRLIECVPNFSEGRNAESLRKLVAAVTAVPGVAMLDQEQDADHHRAVLTFAGPPEAVAEAAFRATREAAGLIDLRQHQGGHPRVGATDVVPFVPIRGVTMEDCVAVARQVGMRIGQELDIPVFLYEQAATRAERKGLENIRRGGLEGLAARMQEEAWAPDFGPRRLHPTAGATVVGARPPLIAYNVNLRTSDLHVAKAIAKTIRQSSGGLPSVKAIGVELASRRIVQVSINLTNYEETPIHAAYEAVRVEAARQGVEVAGSEVIGLVPQRALGQAAEFYLKLEGFDPSQVLEVRLERALAEQGAATATDLQAATASLQPFLDAVAAGTPTPGGGSVAALAGALACSLGIMACRIGPPAKAGGASPGTTGASGPSESLQAAEQQLLALRAKLQGLVQADAQAYETVLQAYRLPKSDPQRLERISLALQEATDVPLETAGYAQEAAALLYSLLEQAKPAVVTDLRVGIVMAMAAAEGAILNAEINVNTQGNRELKVRSSTAINGLKESLVSLRQLC